MSNEQNNVTHLNRDPRSYMQDAAVRRPAFQAATPGAEPHRKFVAKGHDAQLQDAQHNRLPTTLTLVSGAVFTGTVVKRDKFTITLRHGVGANEGQDEIFYKHAIEGVLIERNAPATH